MEEVRVHGRRIPMCDANKSGTGGKCGAQALYRLRLQYDPANDEKLACGQHLAGTILSLGIDGDPVTVIYLGKRSS